MRFSGTQINILTQEVEQRLSDKRYKHTLGVKDAALKLASFFEDLDGSEISVAALLHDITKEYSVAEHEKLMLSNGEKVTDADLLSSAVLHSLTAPYVILRDFPSYATENVLSSVKNHTLGDAEMSVFDEIIFLADYVEDGRTYPSCVEVRTRLYGDLDNASDLRERMVSLHTATVAALSNTLASLRARNECIHPKTLETLDAFVGKLADKRN